MNLEILNGLKEKLIKVSPIWVCIICVLFDSIPFYFFEYSSFKTQFGIISIYSWICCDHKKIRPFLLFVFGFSIDLFNSFIFGISSFILVFLFLLQRSNYEILLSKNFNYTWIRFVVFILVYNLFLLFVHNFFLNEVYFDILEIIYSMIVTIILFPLIFSLVNYFNEKIKYINE